MVGRRWRSSSSRAFGLLELLASTAVFVVILVLAFSVISQTGTLWRQSTKSVEAFQDARTAFETLSRTLSQATLNGYWDYEYSGNQVTRYRRNSSLHFVVGPSGEDGLPGTVGTGQAVFFQAPLGRMESGPNLPELLTEVGFFVSYGGDREWLPSIIGGRPERFRYRLFQSLTAAEQLDVYNHRNSRDWITGSGAFPLAENVVALVVLPRRSAADESLRGPLVQNSFAYDTRVGESVSPQPVSSHQLPPVLELAMVAISEESAVRLGSDASAPPVIQSALAGRLVDPRELKSDLTAIQSELAAANLDVRIFSTTISLKESKWSEY